MLHKRPDKLFPNNRSLSLFNKTCVKPSDNHLSPHSPSSVEKPDLNELKKELDQKSGVLFINNEEISIKMEDFEIESSLGHGTCGTVHKMKLKKLPGIPMAVKQMRCSSHCFEENKRIFRDLDVVTRCQDCPFIVTCYGIFISSSDVWICMEVMETCLDKLLKFLNKPFPEFVIGKVSCAIIKALQYLKTKHNIMHRDIKPSNMLLSSRGEIKLCDFGICAKLKDSIANSRQPGCIGYMAPERLKSTTYDVRADVWSLGMSLIELAMGKFPIDGFKSEFEIITCIIDGKPPTLPPGVYSLEFNEFASSCLQKDYKMRPKYDSLMSSDFYIIYNKEPLDVLAWYKSTLHRSVTNKLPAVNTNIVTNSCQTSSGYASACSDSSPGSLGSQSRSPSSSQLHDTNALLSVATVNRSNHTYGSHQVTRNLNLNLFSIPQESTETLNSSPQPSVSKKNPTLQPSNVGKPASVRHRQYFLRLPFKSSSSIDESSPLRIIEIVSANSSMRGRRGTKPNSNTKFFVNNSKPNHTENPTNSFTQNSRSLSQPPLYRDFLMLETDL